MISTNKRPTGLRKWLALPVLLAVMVLSCSKEQGAGIVKTDNKTAPPPSILLDKLKAVTLKMDSVRISFAGKDAGRVKMLYFRKGLMAMKDSIKASGESVKVIQGPPEIVIEDYKSTIDGKEAEKP